MDPEIEELLWKVLKVFQKDRTLLIGPKLSGINNQEITVDNLRDLAGNHLFDDAPEKFGITKIDGHKIRAYFQATFEMDRERQTRLLLSTFTKLFDFKMELREADCCHSCESFVLEKWTCWGNCELHPEFGGVYFHTICDDFEKRTGDMAFKEQNEKG